MNCFIILKISMFFSLHFRWSFAVGTFFPTNPHVKKIGKKCCQKNQKVQWCLTCYIKHINIVKNIETVYWKTWLFLVSKSAWKIKNKHLFSWRSNLHPWTNYQRSRREVFHGRSNWRRTRNLRECPLPRYYFLFHISIKELL